MTSILKSPGRRGYWSPVLLICAVLLLALFLLPKTDTYQVPQQEYADNTIKSGKILFSCAPGFYDQPFTLKIKAPTTEIYYTLDGTDPERGMEGTYRYTSEGIPISDATENENVHSMRTDVTTGFDLDAVEELSKGRRIMNYQVPDYPVDKCTILRAAYYTLDGERSEIQTGAWFVGFRDREGYGTAKILSIVTDPDHLFSYDTGIYVKGRTFDEFAAADSFHNDDIWYRHFWWWWDANYNRRGREWERPASVMFFSEEGDLLLQQQAGIRIQGGGSRGFLPKSLNLYARREYDGNTRFHYDFFDTGYKAKRLTLTCGGDDCYTKQKDRLVAELASGQDFATMHFEPCILFLDGEFWGLYFLTEKYDEEYFSYYYDVPEEDVTEIKNNQLEIGTEEDLTQYLETKAFIEENDMSDPSNYEKACSLIDIDSFINYYAALIYCARAGDWPNGNYAVWRTRPGTESSGNTAETVSPYADGRWRWVLFDVNSDAISQERKEHDTLHFVLKANKMQMIRSLTANPDFRQKFSDRLLEYGRTIFSPDSVNEKIDSYALEMTAPMKLHFRRFFGEDSGLDFTQITDREIRDFFTDRYSVIEKNIADNLGGETE